MILKHEPNQTTKTGANRSQTSETQTRGGGKFRELRALRKKKENLANGRKKRVKGTTPMRKKPQNKRKEQIREEKMRQRKHTRSKTQKKRSIRIDIREMGLRQKTTIGTPKMSQRGMAHAKKKLKKGNKRLLKAIFQNREIRASICGEKAHVRPLQAKVEFSGKNGVFKITEIARNLFQSVHESLKKRTPEELLHLLFDLRHLDNLSLPQIFFVWDGDCEPNFTSDIESCTKKLKCLILSHLDLGHFNCQRRVIEILGTESFSQVAELLGKDLVT